MKTGVDRHQIRYILFSHFHADHFSDFITFFFDTVFYSRHIGKRPDLAIFGPHGTKRIFDMMRNTFPAFDTAAFRVEIQEIADQDFQIGKTRIISGTVEHTTKLRCVGYRIEYREHALAYSGDTQYCKSLVRLCEGVDTAILDCSFPANRPGPNHMHAGDCGRVAQEAAVKRLILSHFSIRLWNDTTSSGRRPATFKIGLQSGGIC